MIFPPYRPTNLYSESCKIFKSVDDKKIGNGFLVKTGMRRKDIAIAEDKEFLYLINRDNCIIYKTAKTGWGFDGKYKCELKRSFSGYYVLIKKGECRRIRPGRDDDYYIGYSFTIFDEDGSEITKWRWKTDEKSLREETRFLQEEVQINKYPKELGYGLIAYNNTVYELESMTPKFVIPDNFTIQSIIIDNLIYITAPKDECEFVVVVRNGEIIEYDSINNLEQIQNNYSSLSDNKTDLSNRNTDSLDCFIKEYGYQYQVTSNMFCPIELHYHNVERHGSISSLIEENLTEDDFLNIQELDKETTKKLKQISNYIAQKNDIGEKFSKRIGVFLTPKIICLFYRNTYVLRMGINSKYLYRFFDINGKSLSSETYIPLWQNDNNYLFKDTSFDRIFYKMKSADYNKYWLIRILHGELKAFEVSWDDHFIEEKGYIIIYNETTHISKYCDYNLVELDTNYINCKVVPVINNYLYRLDKPFLEEKDYNCGTQAGVCDGKIILNECSPKRVINNGQLFLPTPHSYEKSMEEINARHNNRPNYIDNIVELKKYIIKGETITLYKFKCSPWGYCDINGSIYYDFKKELINF